MNNEKKTRFRKLSQVPVRDWCILSVVMILYLLFLIWVKSWMGLLVIPFIFDLYATKIINWGWWKDLKNNSLRSLMSWVDAIVFALVAVYFANLFLFQNYKIPSSSLEKSLLIGDHLYVSKVAYGPRKPMTPLTMPLTNNTLPGGGRSYFVHPQWEYERVKGFGNIRQNDIVVFNYPSGDTIVGNPRYQQADFYGMVYEIGSSLCKTVMLDSMTVLEQRRVYDFYYSVGRNYIDSNSDSFGVVSWRPVDRRENYVKRCVGLPGQTLQIIDGVVHIDGNPAKQPDNVQFNYSVTLTMPLSSSLRDEITLSKADLPDQYNRPGTYEIPLTFKAAQILAEQNGCVSHIERISQPVYDWLFPLNMRKNWSIDNYGPVWIPKKGETVSLSLENLPFYERIIGVYEGHKLEVSSDGVILIDGSVADSYTFSMDYYWMMGDNRHNSADSRYWGFVPEDHIVGRPSFIWLSINPDRKLGQKGHIRWNRMFKSVSSYN